MAQKTILVVDDERDFLEMVEMRLKTRGYRVFTASDGKEGLRKADENHLDLIILDIMMPGMDGTMTAQKLKDNKKTKDIPIIFLTALVQKGEERDTAHMIGGSVFFAKPFDAKELLAKIEEMIGKFDG